MTYGQFSSISPHVQVSRTPLTGVTAAYCGLRRRRNAKARNRVRGAVSPQPALWGMGGGTVAEVIRIRPSCCPWW
jgi:hypothetical protein